MGSNTARRKESSLYPGDVLRTESAVHSGVDVYLESDGTVPGFALGFHRYTGWEWSTRNVKPASTGSHSQLGSRL